MQRLFITALAFLFSVSVVGQGWEQNYGGSGSQSGLCVIQTDDGSYITVGNTTGGENIQDVYLVKTDVNGDNLWMKTFGDTDFQIGNHVEQTIDGGFIITGTSDSEIDYGFLNRDIYLLKTDENGIEEWTKTFGGTALEHGNMVQQTSDGGYIIAGTTTAVSSSKAVYLIKTDVNGDSLWTKTFEGVNITHANSVHQTTDGGYIISGQFITNQMVSDSDIWLIKTDANGDIIWTNTFGAAGNDHSGESQQTTDGGYIIAGSIGSIPLLLKTDVNGDSLWTKTFGGQDSGSYQSVKETTDGGYVIAGSIIAGNVSDYDVLLIKTDANGDSLWTKTFGAEGYDVAYHVEQTADGGYIITGSTPSFSGNVYLIKTDSLGNVGLYGCSDPTACNFNIEVTEDDGSCWYAEIYYDCDGVCINDADGDGVCDELEVSGCTDQEADNYNPEATENDDSCIILGCMDTEADNYNSAANQDDTSCLYDIDYVNDATDEGFNDGFNDGVNSVICPNPTCAGDLNNDNTVSIGDLLDLLTLFGNDCE